MKKELDSIFNLAQEEINQVQSLEELEKLKVKYLGRKSTLFLFFKDVKKLPLPERKRMGQRANEIKEKILHLFEVKTKTLEKPLAFKKDFFDITRPGKKNLLSHLHPITLALKDLLSIFGRMGFQIVEGPDIETEYYNFDALRIPFDHPAREMWDTFWVKPFDSGLLKKKEERLLLKTHTSPMQIRFMEKNEPPFRLVAFGRCFRYEATDASHEIQFHQIEGLMVGENVNLTNFKFIVEEFLNEFFNKKIEIRFRNSYFPFVSPGLEVDIRLKNNNKKSIYSDKWLEIMGAGMVHPELFERVNYDKNKWQGFAFGLGVERLAMIKYNIDDIRLFFSSDLRFLKQF